MHFLTAERRSRLRVLLANLAEGQREHEEISRLDAQIRVDYHGRFLIELIQNAIDPAQQAGLLRSRLLIVRTTDYLAVLNQGVPFDDKGLKALLSLGLSSKQPDEAIGNKGVGFKSVFEVADLAEVFGTEGEARSLAATPTLRLALSKAAASEHAHLVEEALGVAQEDGLAQRIEERTGEALEESIRSALAVTAGWRFPIQRSSADWSRRCKALGLSNGDLAPYTTAVVLHVSAGQQALVDRALAELTSAADEVHLFLPGLESLEVRTPEQRFRLLREELVVPGAEGVGVRRLVTLDGDDVVRDVSYWVLATTIEGPEVAAAARQLPGAGWSSVRRAVVQVALPIGETGEAPAPDGRYFVGLPTKDPTGSPFRVDARFHATLSRTALDRVDNPYNRLLDQAAADLAARLLLLLRDAPVTTPYLVQVDRARRTVTYGLVTQGRNGFGKSVQQRLAGEAIAWNRRGDGFLLPADALLRREEDHDILDLAIDRLGVQALQVRRIELVDEELEREAGAVLQALGCPAVEPRHLVSPEFGPSLLEVLATGLPRQDGEAWGVLLGWVLERAVGQVAGQRFLPVTGGALARPQDAPFVPLGPSPARGELGIADVPVNLLAYLLFLDGAVLGDDPDLRRKLVEGEHPLCRKATAYDLLEHAMLPTLARQVEAGEDARARQILQVGLRLLAKVPPTESVVGLPWRVPCGGGWKPADEAYLGDSWSLKGRKPEDPPGLVEAVYGPAGRCVLPWWGPTDERGAARAALQRAGVADEPRIFTWEPLAQIIWGDCHRGEVRNPAPPDPMLAGVWSAWLSLVTRTASVDWGPRTWWGLDNVQWIDGLERPEAAPLLAAWALTQKHESASLVPQADSNAWGRYRYKNPGSVIQPWVLALRQVDTPFVPTAKSCVFKGEAARPSDLCRVPMRAHVPPWLPKADPDLVAETLELVGVRALVDMPTGWLVEQLGVFAGSLAGSLDEGAVARGLWGLVAAQVKKSVLPPLESVRLPLWRDGSLVAVPGGEIDRLLLVDDAYAAEVLGTRLDGAFQLEPGDQDWSVLLGQLREALPKAQVQAVSELDLPFAPATSRPTVEVVGHLRRHFGARVIGVLAAVIHRSGIAQKDMHRCWRALHEAKLQLGGLGPKDPPAVWLAEPGVLIAQPLAPADLVIELWPILGARWRNDLLALGHALSRGERGLQDHLRHHKLTEEAIADAAAFFKLDDWTTPVVGPIPSAGRTPAHAATPALALLDVTLDTRGDDEVDGEWPVDPRELATRVALAPVPPHLPRPTSTVPAHSGGREHLPAPAAAHAHPTNEANGNEAYAREIGHLGELFAYRVLSSTLPGFDEACWVSSSRQLLGLPAGDDTLGYDFKYVDATGQLSDRRGVTCFIDVKANAKGMRRRFSVSTNEWELASACSASPDQVFVLLRVHGIATQPEVGALIVDPVGHAAGGRLRLAPKDGWWVDVVAAEREPGEE